MNNRLGLGTVQFGLPYGIANQAGQIRNIELAKILDYAWEAGINVLDTAIEYGNCETILGKTGVKQWQVVSKIPEIPEACKDISSWVLDSIAGSLNRLGISRLRGLLLHRSQQLHTFQGQDLYQALVIAREKGWVEKIGVSIYDPKELDALWPHFQFDLVQTPLNILDRRLVSTGWLARLNHAGIEVHARSIFLQGLLLMNAKHRPKKFDRWQPLWDEWHCWLANHGTTALQVCIGFAMSLPEIDRVIIGVDSLEQLEEILACRETSVAIPPETLASEDLDLINPSLWNTF